MAELIPPPPIAPPIPGVGEIGIKVGGSEVFKGNQNKSAETFKSNVEGERMANKIDTSIQKIQKDNLDPAIPIHEIATSDLPTTAEQTNSHNNPSTTEAANNENVITGNNDYDALQRRINARSYMFNKNGLLDSQSEYLSAEKSKDYDNFVREHPNEAKTLAPQDPEIQAAINRTQENETNDISKTVEQYTPAEKMILQRLDELTQENAQLKQEMEALRTQNTELTETVNTQKELQEKLKPVVEELVNEELDETDNEQTTKDNADNSEATNGQKPPETEAQKKKRRKQLLKTILMIIGGVGVAAATGIVSSSKS